MNNQESLASAEKAIIELAKSVGMDYPDDFYPCHFCGSTKVGHHVKGCEFAFTGELMDVPENEYSKKSMRNILTNRAKELIVRMRRMGYNELEIGSVVQDIWKESKFKLMGERH